MGKNSVKSLKNFIVLITATRLSAPVIRHEKIGMYYAELEELVLTDALRPGSPQILVITAKFIFARITLIISAKQWKTIFENL